MEKRGVNEGPDTKARLSKRQGWRSPGRFACFVLFVVFGSNRHHGGPAIGAELDLEFFHEGFAGIHIFNDGKRC